MVAISVGLGVAVPAAGQDSAASEALFNKGVAEMEAGRYPAACPALAESHRLDPRAGTVFTLAECEMKWGKLASAVAHYSDYVGLVSRMQAADKARHGERVKTAEQQLAKLRPQVPQLSLVLPGAAPKGTVVKRDGVTLSEVSLGSSLPVDPGEHVIVTQVPSGPEHEQKVSIGVGENKRVELEIELPKDSASPQPVGAAPASGHIDTSTAPGPEHSPSGAGRTWGYVAGGIGVAGLAVGTVTGLMSMSKKKIVDDNCSGAVCNEQGVSAADDGKTLGTISTVGFGIGIAGLATGVVLLLTAPKAESKESSGRSWQPTVFASQRAASVGLLGSW